MPTDKIKESIAQLAENAPSLLAFVLFAGLFLYYQERNGSREDLVAKQRIDQCHQVQSESIEAIKKLTESMQLQALAFQELSLTVKNIKD